MRLKLYRKIVILSLTQNFKNLQNNRFVKKKNYFYFYIIFKFKFRITKINHDSNIIVKYFF